MTDGRVVRRWATIIAAEITDYPPQIGPDESGTFAQLKAHRAECWELTRGRYGGRQVKLTGESALFDEFSSVVDVLEAAIEFQQLIVDANAGRPEDTAAVFHITQHNDEVLTEIAYDKAAMAGFRSAGAL